MELGSGTEELSDAHLGLQHRAAPELFWEGCYPNSLLSREQTSSAADSITLIVFPSVCHSCVVPWGEEEKESLALK